MTQSVIDGLERLVADLRRRLAQAVDVNGRLQAEIRELRRSLDKKSMRAP